MTGKYGKEVVVEAVLSEPVSGEIP